MTFSKEDKAAWQDSEIMREFERIAKEQDVLGGPPPEAFQPVGVEEDEKTWEEDDDKDKLLDAVDELGVAQNEESPVDVETLPRELLKAYTTNLLTNLEKVSYDLASGSKMKAAYRIDRTLHKINSLMREE